MEAVRSILRTSRWGVWVLTMGGTAFCAVVCMVVTGYFMVPFGWPVTRISLALAGGLPTMLGAPIFGFLAIKLRQLSETNEQLIRLNRIDSLTAC